MNLGRSTARGRFARWGLSAFVKGLIGEIGMVMGPLQLADRMIRMGLLIIWDLADFLYEYCLIWKTVLLETSEGFFLDNFLYGKMVGILDAWVWRRTRKST